MISIGASKRWPYSASCARGSAPSAPRPRRRRRRRRAPRCAPRSPARRSGSRPGAARAGDPAGPRRRRAGRRPGATSSSKRAESCASSRLLSAWRSVPTNSCWRSVASRPVAARMPGVRRHEHARDLELERDVAGEQRPRAARGDERELARVVAAPHGVELDRLGHPVLLDLQRAERRLLDRHPELAGDVLIAVSASARSSCIAPPSRPRSERRRPSRSWASVEVGSAPPRP